MSLVTILTRPCAITRRSSTVDVDEYGDEIATTTTAVTVCELQQRERTEVEDRGEIGRSEWLLVLPAGTPIDLGSTVTIDDRAFEVSGEPWHVRNPRTGQLSHVEVTLVRTTTSGESGS
ncbi:MAG: hypothetical protein Q8O56_06195 [Solirubrobacteraceae bacterium]|nr:hypothetical protein [Solirubrobacteraceae bacterium]